MHVDPHWLALSLMPGVGARLFHRLLATFGSAAAVFAAPRAQLQAVAGLRQQSAEAIKAANPAALARAELERCRNLGIEILLFGDAGYPEHLANIHDPPPVLYVRGRLEPGDRRAVAIVGSRRASSYGMEACSRLAAELAANGWTVVSGMARGIDSAAHRGAIAAGGRTVAVMGTGVDRVYPRENRRLWEQICASGAVVGEFPLGTPPEASNFPVRNRVISGLALGVVVVEATAKSGSLITARLALDQGRVVFAVPGPVNRPGSAGPHHLLKQGAVLVERAEDVVEELAPMLGDELGGGQIAAAGLEEATIPLGLEGREQEVWEAMGTDTVQIDALAAGLKWEVAATAEILLHLELKGLVAQLPGARFRRRSPSAVPRRQEW